MRQRYFSPEIRFTLNSCKADQLNILRSVGSASKLASSLSTISFQDETQHCIGPYTYDTNKQIGSGYSSKVYMARKIDDQKDYAIKVIELKKYSNSNLQMLTNEIEILSSLDHPNILRCFDVFRTKSQCFIVTEFCREGDLKLYLTKRGKIPEKDSLDIITQILEGYIYLAQKQIIHRDLKPANILKCGNVWKIADFGFAIQCEGQLKSRYNVGTPLYMPLQSLIENRYSIKSDLFSIGVIFFELMTGCTPWESKTQRDLIRKMSIYPLKVSSKHNISAKTKLLLEKLCSSSEKNRMTKEELFSLKKMGWAQIEHIAGGKERNREKLKKYKSLEKMQKIMKEAPLKVPDEPEKLKKADSQSNCILIHQFRYCRFLYYFAKNNNNLVIDKKNSQKLTLLLYKHLLKLMKHLSDANHNWFKFQDWNKLRESKKYLSNQQTLTEYYGKYEKQYLIFLRMIDDNVISEVSETFFNLSSMEPFSQSFYCKVLDFLQPMIRGVNHSLGLILAHRDDEMDKQTSGQIEALKSLHKYYELVQISVNHFENYHHFKLHSDIKVVVDYKKAGNSVENCGQFLKALKYI